MSDYHGHVEIKAGSERNFGIVFSIVFGLVGIWLLFNDDSVRVWSLAVGVVMLLLGLFRPRTLSVPNKIWFRFGMLIGSVVAPIVMALLFFLVVTPTGIIMRALGKDLLRQKIDKSSTSYWIKRDGPVGSMKDQF